MCETIIAVCNSLRSSSNYLTRLDQLTGDGDMGVNVVAACKKIEHEIGGALFLFLPWLRLILSQNTPEVTIFSVSSSTLPILCDSWEELQVLCSALSSLALRIRSCRRMSVPSSYGRTQ